MRKAILPLLGLLATVSFAHAQNTFPSTGAVGIGTTAPNTSSLLEVNSTTKGALLPRMTTTQRNAISTPAQGLLIFQTDGTSGFYYYNSGWKAITPSTSGFAAKSLNNLTTTAINTSLLPKTTKVYDLGSVSLAWRNLHLRDDIYLDGTRFVSNAPGTVAQNAFLGSYAGQAVTSGAFNTALGHNALLKDTSGSRNTAVGANALYSNTNGYGNTATGDSALRNNITGVYNTATGYQALLNNSSGSENVATGFYTLRNSTTGYYNTAVGDYALAVNTTTGSNTAIGYNAGNYGTSSTSTSLGHSAGATTNGLFNWTSIGYGSTPTQSNQVMLGNSLVTSIGGYVNYTNFSDGRYKKNIKEDVPGLAFITQLRPITYTLDVNGINEKLGKGKAAGQEQISGTEREAIIAKSKIVYTGFSAQEVEAATQKLDYDFSGVDKPQSKDGFYGLRYGDFVVPLVKAVQELDSVTKELKDENKVLKETVNSLQQQVDDLKALITGNTTANSAALSSIELTQNTPNPFNRTTTIHYTLPAGISKADLLISDYNGKIIKTIPISSIGSGSVTIDASLLSSGAYNYSIVVEGRTIATKKMIVTK